MTKALSLVFAVLALALACVGLAGFPLAPAEARGVAEWAMKTGRAPRFTK